jgi:simple sugar transport system permease protein
MNKAIYSNFLLNIFIIIFVVMALVSPDKFLSLNNLQSMARQLPELGILSLGMMVVIISGGIDLSITSTAALSGIMAAYVMSMGYNPEMSARAAIVLIFKALLVLFATALICGSINGFFISRIGVHPVLATLGSMTLFEGISLAITKGGAVSGFPKQYFWFGSGSILFIPTPLIIFIIVAVVTAILLEKTAWGRSLYMFGSNPVATFYSGINTAKVNFLVYIYSASMAALATLIMISRYNSAKVDYGSSYLLQSIAIVVLGGTSIEGGYGRVIGTVIAVCITQVINTGFNIMGVNRFIVDITSGVILLVVLLLNLFLSRMRNRKLIKKEQKGKAELVI